MADFSQSILEFPCEFPIKIIGNNNPQLEAAVTAILCKHVPNLDPNAITDRLSSGSKYKSFSATFTADSREQLDALYIELTAHEQIIWVL